MIDFSNCEVNYHYVYGGANGGKLNIVYKGEQYMLKFPPVSRRNKTLDYTNGCISEYLGCHIFKSLGFDTQETLLGTYTTKSGKEKVVVACKNFTVGGKRLFEFAQVKNTIIDSEGAGYGTELSSVLEAISSQKVLSPSKVLEFFWDMFIVDALLGNFDRHNGNWGFLFDDLFKAADIAPIYDCGSCLYPQMNPEDIPTVLSSDAEVANRIFVFPSSILKVEDKKLSYFDFISSNQNSDCTAALLKIHPRIDISEIYSIVDNTPSLLPTQKEFYKTMLSERKKRILDYSVQQIRG